MEKMILDLKDEYIKLGQALKAAGLVSSGVDAKMMISKGLVKVDGKIEMRRGRKLYDGAVVVFEGQELLIRAKKKEEE